MSLPFLLEIGTEEIPDWMIPGALENLRALFEEALAKSGISAQSVRVDATPRRLVLRAEGLAGAAGRFRRAGHRTCRKRACRGCRRLREEAGHRADALTLQSTRRASITAYTKKIAGRAVERDSGRSAARRHPENLLSRRPCTGPGKTDRASSGRSAGSSRCSATKWSRSRLRA